MLPIPTLPVAELSNFVCGGCRGRVMHNKKERSPTWAKEIPIHRRGNVPVARNPIPKPHKRQNQSIRKTAQYSNQISTLLGVPPLNFQ